jgi:hypothetical protein
MKKRINTKVEKIVAGTVSVSILASSCTPYHIHDDIIYEVNVPSEDIGEIAVPISITLSPAEAKYASFLQKLSQDIINDPDIAKEFAKNPDAFLKKYGYEDSISLDESMLKLVLALGDDDINEAIISNNIKLFYELCKEKKLLNESTLFQNIVIDKDTKDKLNEIGINISAETYAWAIFVPLAVAIVAVAFIAVVAYIAAVTDMMMASSNKNIEFITENNPVLNIWALKNKKDKTYVVIEEFLENQINNIVDVVKQSSPSYFDNHSEEELRNLLKINMIK